MGICYSEARHNGVPASDESNGALRSQATGGAFFVAPDRLYELGAAEQVKRRHDMTTSGYNPTAMPGPETRYIPHIPDFTPRSTDGIVTDGSKTEGD
jgi:hypothetical protein